MENSCIVLQYKSYDFTISVCANLFDLVGCSVVAFSGLLEVDNVPDGVEVLTEDPI